MTRTPTTAAKLPDPVPGAASAGLGVPSLWLYGRSDPLVSHRYGRRVADTVPSAEVEVWDDLGQVPQFELPDRTHALVRRFLARTEAGR